MTSIDFTTKDLVSMIHSIIIILWPATTLAAGDSLGATMGAITIADSVSVLVLSGFSGLAALLHRVRRSMEADALHEAGEASDEVRTGRQRIAWPWFAVCHMVGAVFVGTMAFLLCEAFDMNNYLEAAAISLCSWSGAKVADKWADGLSDGVLSRINAVFGGNKQG